MCQCVLSRGYADGEQINITTEQQAALDDLHPSAKIDLADEIFALNRGRLHRRLDTRRDHSVFAYQAHGSGVEGGVSLVAGSLRSEPLSHLDTSPRSIDKRADYQLNATSVHALHLRLFHFIRFGEYSLDGNKHIESALDERRYDGAATNPHSSIRSQRAEGRCRQSRAHTAEDD